jgi:hypothetical protein
MPYLAQSVCGVLMGWFRSPIKKGVVVAVILFSAPLLLVSIAAFATGDWRPAGSTPAGDQVSVSSVSPLRNGTRTAWIRVEYKEPTRLPQGGSFVELRARVRYNCRNGNAVPNSEWFYSRDRSGKLVVSRKMRRDDQFGQESEGNFGEIAKDFVCRQK